MTRHRAVLVDLDGTLVDTLGEITAAVNATLREAGRDPVDEPRVAGAVGEGSSILLDHLFGVGESVRWLPVYMRHYRIHNGSLATLYPNARAGLVRMREQGLALACVTNKPRELVLPLLQRLDVASLFTVVLGAGEVAQKKPHPAPLFAACERMGVDATAGVMIGDSQNDALAAQAAGMASLTVPYGYPGIAGDAGRPEALLARGITCAIVPDLLAAGHWIAARNGAEGAASTSAAS